MSAEDFEARGIQAAKAGDKDEARQLLQQSLRLNPENDTAWLWLASVMPGKRDQVRCLQRVLEINPENDMALNALARLGIDPQRLMQPKTDVPVQQREYVEPVEHNGVPYVDENVVQALIEQADYAMQAHKQPEPEQPFTWVHKSKGRAGENEIILLRLQRGAALLAALIVLGVIGALVYDNSPRLQVIVQGPSLTPLPPTFTPTNTPTNTPGFTPTPSATRNFTEEPTFTPSPTPPLTITPGQIEITPRPTDIDLPDDPVQAVLLSDELINEGDADEALPLLATARSQLGTTFSPNPFYYEALALAQIGNYEGALNTLREAESRITNFEGVRADRADFFLALIEAGFARVYLEEAESAFRAGDQATGIERVQLARERAESAIENDPDLAVAHIALADSYLLTGETELALERIAEAQQFPELANDLNLIIARGRAALRESDRLNDPEAVRGALEAARYEAFYATYLNPYNEDAHQLQVETALALGDPGLAVLDSQRYLLFFPESAEAFRLLGNARVAEGNTDLALAAYNQALESGGNDAIVADILASRAGLYSQQRRYDDALTDLNAAIELGNDPAIRAQRMIAAYNAGEYQLASTDANFLLGTGIIPDSEIQLIQARILVDQADENDDYAQALGLLNDIRGELDDDLLPAADEYLARAHLALGNLGDALNAVIRAINVEETGTRHYLLGQIYEARDERANAIAEYQWVLTWDQVYDYAFAPEAAERIAAIRERTAEEQAAATATAVTATAEANATATAQAEGS